jgi:hypothetical protein
VRASASAHLCWQGCKELPTGCRSVHTLRNRSVRGSRERDGHIDIHYGAKKKMIQRDPKTSIDILGGTEVVKRGN